MTPEEILHSTHQSKECADGWKSWAIIEAMEQYGKDQYDKGVNDSLKYISKSQRVYDLILKLIK